MKIRGPAQGLEPPTFSDLLNGSLPQITQKCNKKFHGKKTPLSPLTFQMAAGPLNYVNAYATLLS